MALVYIILSLPSTQAPKPFQNPLCLKFCRRIPLHLSVSPPALPVNGPLKHSAEEDPQGSGCHHTLPPRPTLHAQGLILHIRKSCPCLRWCPHPLQRWDPGYTPPPWADRSSQGHRIPLTSNLLNSNGTNYVMLYFSQLEWAELAPHKVTGKIFGWFRTPGPQRLTCDGRPCPDLGSKVSRHHCPPDTGQLCAGHEA